MIGAVNDGREKGQGLSRESGVKFNVAKVQNARALAKGSRVPLVFYLGVLLRFCKGSARASLGSLGLSQSRQSLATVRLLGVLAFGPILREKMYCL